MEGTAYVRYLDCVQQISIPLRVYNKLVRSRGIDFKGTDTEDGLPFQVAMLQALVIRYKLEEEDPFPRAVLSFPQGLEVKIPVAVAEYNRLIESNEPIYYGSDVYGNPYRVVLAQVSARRLDEDGE